MKHLECDLKTLRIANEQKKNNNTQNKPNEYVASLAHDSNMYLFFILCFASSKNAMPEKCKHNRKIKDGGEWNVKNIRTSKYKPCILVHIYAWEN